MQLKAWLNENQLNELKQNNEKLNGFIDKLTADNVEFVTLTDEKYPPKLRTVLRKNAPPFLLMKGNSQLLNKNAVGFCGSRNASDRGLEIAKDCANQLAEKGITVISGHAAGVDQATHFEALVSGGSTIIVLPEGIFNFRIRKALRPVWNWDKVLVISEFLPHAIWSTSRAMQRNKTIIGLSDVMVLIEAGKNGGSMDAGRKSLALGHNLYVPVYEGMPESAIGNRILLQTGALELKRHKSTDRANLERLLRTLNPSSEIETTGQQVLNI